MRQLMLAIVLLLIGCGGTADATRTPTRTARPPTTVPEPTPDADSPRAEVIRSYIDASFAQTTWYPAIQDVQVRRDTVNIHTTTFSDPIMRDVARSICQSVSGYIFSNDNPDKDLTHIQVTNAAGRTVSDRRGLGGSC